MALRYGLMAGWLSIFGVGWMGLYEADAGMIGSPVAVYPRGTLAVGIEGDMINRELRFDTADHPGITMVEAVSRGTYGVYHRTNVFFTLGMVDDDFKVSNYRGTDLTFLSKQATAYGAGFKLTVYEISGFLLGGGGQYDRFTLESEKSTSLNPSADADLRWQEFRFFVGAQVKDIPYFAPYGGLYLTKIRGQLGFSGSTPPGTDVRESQSIGLFYGGDFKVWKKMVLSAELRLIAETSVAFSIQYAF
jgi:hypothetical protein